MHHIWKAPVDELKWKQNSSLIHLGCEINWDLGVNGAVRGAVSQA